MIHILVSNKNNHCKLPLPARIRQRGLQVTSAHWSARTLWWVCANPTDCESRWQIAAACCLRLTASAVTWPRGSLLKCHTQFLICLMGLGGVTGRLGDKSVNANMCVTAAAQKNVKIQ